ncbi:MULTISPECIES: hypothetical protein [unclassified Microbacterium]|uniref:hypothetical protein n=1 Tax=unclassified Microbacterium TaxID=2609290 RepID=UPI000CFC4A70|nr:MULTISPECIES: hypothetical protein [unclassified Microbacterium]PQZ61056.1 hypothetical protein CQ032_00710 [Microbacterium sp. MYb43]PQZ82266.1 hypothetical protein CQ031_02330 [Microbacterium sp. MYb40]PRB24033.1 hypothetical protein CQ040_01895 [Microbacterium sp. MYb54]PRB30864.1 hypothetical protein CQ037_05150 [Microbacterium sp. MYb50]PRB70714.1 hypothetical protein CQ021_00710 [Microbacterium sp. MYb24]
MSISDCIAVLETHNVQLDPGLTSSEFVEIEQRYGFEFSPDHRQLLETVMPIGNGWVDWRNGSEESIQGRLDWPLDGLLFDVEHNSFWPSTWPAKPDTLNEQREVATERIRRWPTLVPIYSHRYTPAAPAPVGAPVFSVWQSDVIFYGDDLLDYLTHEFGPADLDYYQRESEVGPETCPPWSLLPFELDIVD